MSKRLITIALAGVAVILLASCHNKKDEIKIEANIKGLSQGQIEIKLLSGNKLLTIDSVSVNSDGYFSSVIKGLDTSYDFYYLYYRDRRIVSLLTRAGECIKIDADTLGNVFSIDGSAESLLLCELDDSMKKRYEKFDSLMELYNRAQEAKDSKKATELNYEMGNLYVKSKQYAIKYLYTHPHSLTVMPLIYYKFSNGLPLFTQSSEDRMLLSSIADSLSILHRESYYYKSLIANMKLMDNETKINEIIANAEQVGFLDISLPDINSVQRRLSEFKGKCILLWFWTAIDVKQKMVNLEFRELYNKYRDSGFEIYQVCVDQDKTAWAQIVKSQNLPWISVCDGLGSNSPAVISYNVAKVPMLFIINKSGDISALGDLSASNFKDQIERAIKANLK